MFAKARGKDQMKAIGSLTAVVDGQWRIVDDPPVVSHVEIAGRDRGLEKTFSDYRATLAENRRELIERYRFVDFALKVVGVGSVGTRCFVVLLEGRDEGDPLILQAKEATASVLDPYLETSHHANHGERVVVGQRLMQATPDIFLGWTRGPGWPRLLLPPAVGHEGLGRHRDPAPAGPGVLRRPVRPVAGASPRPERRCVAIAAYLGTSDTFDGAIADFAEAYADQNERDYKAFTAAIADGRIAAQSPADRNSPGPPRRIGDRVMHRRTLLMSLPLMTTLEPVAWCSSRSWSSLPLRRKGNVDPSPRPCPARRSPPRNRRSRASSRPSRGWPGSPRGPRRHRPGELVRGPAGVGRRGLRGHVRIGWGDCPAGCIDEHTWIYAVGPDGRSIVLARTASPYRRAWPSAAAAGRTGIGRDGHGRTGLPGREGTRPTRPARRARSRAP